MSGAWAALHAWVRAHGVLVGLIVLDVDCREMFVANDQKLDGDVRTKDLMHYMIKEEQPPVAINVWALLCALALLVLNTSFPHFAFMCEVQLNRPYCETSFQAFESDTMPPVLLIIPCQARRRNPKTMTGASRKQGLLAYPVFVSGRAREARFPAKFISSTPICSPVTVLVLQGKFHIPGLSAMGRDQAVSASETTVTTELITRPFNAEAEIDRNKNKSLRMKEEALEVCNTGDAVTYSWCSPSGVLW